MKKIAPILLIVFISISSFTFAHDKWTPADIIHMEYLRSPIFSPDGSMLVWTKKIANKKADEFASKLFLTRLDQGEKPVSFQITFGTSSESEAIFSKDGKYIYFLSDREKGKKLWRLNVLGGEPEKVHDFKDEISSIKFLDEQNITFISNDGKTLYESIYEKKKDDTEIVEDEDHWKASRVYAFNLKTKKIKRLSTKQNEVTDYAVSADGLFMVTQRTMSLAYHTDGKTKPEITLYNLKSGASKLILKDQHLPSGFKFSPDSKGVYFTTEATSDERYNGPGQTDLNYYDIMADKSYNIPLKWENGISRGYYVSGDYLLVDLANGPLKKLGIYKKEGNEWTSLKHNLGQWDKNTFVMEVAKKNLKVMYSYSTASKLPVYSVADLKLKKKILEFTNPKIITQLNKKLLKKPIAKSEVIYWKGANDAEINGILYYPKNYKEGEKFPLILSIHGGPTGVDQDQWSERWSTYPQIMTDKGAFVLKPNYHGSGNHGQAFAESIGRGKYYKLNQIDLYNAIQHLNNQGLINMDKLGLMGWSNGAILTTWMTLKYPDMFKVASPGAGDINWTSDYGTCRFGVTFDQYYFGGAPWDDTNGTNYNVWYTENSPLFDIEKIKTPTIIFHGSEDRSVPRDQGWEYFRGLQQVGKATVKFLWFPGQPHGLQKISHQFRKMNEELKWFDKYLFNTYKEENEAFKKDSPLASMLLKSKAKSYDGKYGIEKEGLLFPEMKVIDKNGKSVSLFELTNAQYATYEKSHSYFLSEANYPVYGLNKTEIEAYINWLNDRTGKTYRLPNAQEAKEWHKMANKSAANENTLNYWAGYEITLDDAIKLKTKISDNLQLIKEVGSYAPIKIGKAKLFDLGGNVAEYYWDGKQLKVYGYDAYSFSDPLDIDFNESIHIGVRLVME